MLDVTTTMLEVPDTLRESGVQSVLGVRVPRESELLGVLYVGIPEKRKFTPREIDRLETLADRLALHLEKSRAMRMGRRS
jgi:GAF domain-containing protein